MSISFDGWKNVAGRKLLGVLALLFGQPSGTVMVDFLGTTDITELPETTDLVALEVERALESARVANSFLPPLPSGTRDDSCPSVLTSIVSDSASCNVGAKKLLAQRWPTVIMVACFAHQLNLLTPHIITHPLLLAVAAKGAKVVLLFSQSTKWRKLLEVCMDDVLGRRWEIEKRGETSWYSHFGMVNRLIKLKPALEAFAHTYNNDRALRLTRNGGVVLEMIRSQEFWDQTDLTARLLRPIVIEIGVIERRSSNLSAVCASFGRLFAYFTQLKNETAASAFDASASLVRLFPVAADPAVTDMAHSISVSLLRQLQWRWKRYYDAPLLVLSHVLDPTRHTAGLLTTDTSWASHKGLLQMFLALASRFGLPRRNRDAATTEDVACRTAQLFLGDVGNGPHSLLAFNLGSPTAGNDRVAAMVMWRLTSALEGSVVADVALHLFSVPAHAAELERVWSGMGLANTPLRNRLDTDRLTDMTKVVLQMRAALAK